MDNFLFSLEILGAAGSIATLMALWFEIIARRRESYKFKINQINNKFYKIAKKILSLKKDPKKIETLDRDEMFFMVNELTFSWLSVKKKLKKFKGYSLVETSMEELINKCNRLALNEKDVVIDKSDEIIIKIMLTLFELATVDGKFKKGHFESIEKQYKALTMEEKKD
ncbi:hypothetical protein [Mesoplasma photuris]|uniref:hypothetical protein n=1 Tax=Mesoplasma photuris TaxID=217731 RepID=UPI0004E1C615|nr:hypothetical protein [Mesoplasma photuris]